MSAIREIHSTNPSGPLGLENRRETGNRKLFRKGPLPKENFSFDVCLDRQINRKNFKPQFKKAGHAEAADPNFLTISLNDIVPELHFPFSFLKQI
jgi:hypothetical protein